MALFEREDPRSALPEDARHWIGVYQSLVDFCEMFQSAENPPPKDRQLLDVHDAHFRARLEFWRQRLVDLNHNGH
jgi:hypothetical protein